MAIPVGKIENISFEVIKVLSTRFETFPVDASNNRNAPFHKAFLNAFVDKFQGKVSDIPFFISLSSWLQGLNTTLGQTFFENVGHILSDGEKREYTSGKAGNLLIGQNQKDTINYIITNLSTAQTQPNLQSENEKIFVSDSGGDVSAIDFSADIFFEDEEQITAIELKSVRPNSGEMRGEKQKILEGKAALFRHFSGKPIQFFIGFPFDPTSESSPTGYDKSKFLSSIINMNKFFAPEEVLLSGELWDFLSGEIDTMEQLLEIINRIATTEFLAKLLFLNKPENKKENLELYKNRLAEWNLHSELKLVINENTIVKKIEGNKKLTKLHNQLVFKDGEYNIDRFNSLNGLIDN